MGKSGNGPPGVTLRAVVIGLILIPLNCYWVAQSEAISGLIYLTMASLFFNATFTLLILIGLNALYKQLAPKAALKQGELLTIYVMVCLGSSVTGNNFLENLVLSLGHGSWFATPENEWADLFLRYMPDWLAVKDKAVLRGFYEGDSSFYFAEHIGSWLKPLAFWGGFTIILIFTLLCVTVLIRKQWTEREKLSYPVIQLPLALTQDGTGGNLFSNGLFLLSFGVIAAITLVNGLHYYYPTIPELHLVTDIGHLFTEKPWNSIGWMPVVVYPWIVGLAFFIPLDLCFSVWFFYLFAKFQRVIAGMGGWHSLPGYPYFIQQTTGGWLALSVIALWLTRKHLKSIFIQIFRRSASTTERYDHTREPMSPRTAMIGFLLGFSFLVIFCAAGGMTLWIAISFFALLVGMEITISRMRAELGPPSHELLWVGPDTILVTALGSKRLGGKNLAMLTLLYFTDRAMASHPMPHQLEGFKIAERVGINVRKLTAAMMTAVIVGVVSSLWIWLHYAYEKGVSSGFMGYIGIPVESFTRLSQWLNYPSGTNLPELGFIGIGFVFSLAMMFLRTRFLWWPLHPVGYALSTSGWIFNYIWFSFMVAWLVKWIILRHGGIRVYRKATPFFFGLILGEYAVGCFWNLFGILMGLQAYGSTSGLI